MTTPEELDARHAADAIAAMNSARDFPTHTCPASRHAAMIAEGLAGEGYAMLSEEPQHCATTIAAVVESLWKARARVAELEAEVTGYREWGADVKRLTRQIDVEMHGEEGAAKQASLCDLVGAGKDLRDRAEAAEAELARRGQGVRVKPLVDDGESLLPCPFCGSEVRMIEGEESAYIQCLGVKMHRAIWFSGDNCAADEVREQWNIRAALVSPGDGWRSMDSAPKDGTQFIALPWTEALEDLQVTWWIAAEGRWANWTWAEEPCWWTTLLAPPASEGA